MNSKNLVKYTKYFSRQVNQLYKKYPSLLSDLDELKRNLLNEPRIGIPLGNNSYKIRLAIKSKGKGKSGGARVISYVETEVIGVIENNKVSLLTIYDKSKIASLSKEEIASLIKNME